MKDCKYTLSIGAKLQSPKRVYTVSQVLGQGGFGITYKVSANVLVDNVIVGTSFAVKEFFLKESCERDAHDSVCYSSPVKDKVEESKKDFLAEAQRLNKISIKHPNLIHVNEVFEANNTVYYVMEYLDGGSLRSYVRQHGALSEHETLEIMLPILKAVDFLHQNRMTHLDIKPDNIMLKRDVDSSKIIPVLIDFGLSKHYDKNGKPTSSIRILGCSDGYAPMEQYVGINTFTPQADVYALAATLFFVLTGKDPVIATELSKNQIIGSLPNTISSKIKDAIVAAMKMRKEERTQAVRFLLNSLAVQQENVSNSESFNPNVNQTKTIKNSKKGGLFSKKATKNTKEKQTTTKTGNRNIFNFSNCILWASIITSIGSSYAIDIPYPLYALIGALFYVLYMMMVVFFLFKAIKKHTIIDAIFPFVPILLAIFVAKFTDNPLFYDVLWGLLGGIVLLGICSWSFSYRKARIFFALVFLAYSLFNGYVWFSYNILQK